MPSLKNSRNAMLLLLLSCSLYACNGGWDQESKDLFYQSCMEDAKEHNLSEAKAQSVCKCRLETVQRKYPTLANAMDNVDKLMHDEDLKKCE
jgi:hypothetical protein